MDEYELDNGHTVRVGDQYTMNYDNVQLGVPTGTTMTVDDIKRYPDGIHVLFTTLFPDSNEPGAMDAYEGDPVTIYAFAMANLLDDNDLLAR